MSATNFRAKRPANLINCEEIVEKEKFYIELKNFYKDRKKGTKPEWTLERINYVIGLLELYNDPELKNKAKTSQQYHYSRKYEVVTIGNEKSLIIKRKDPIGPVISIVASEDYYNHLMLTHVSTGHGGRDKIISTLRNQYYIPVPAINIFTRMCKVCLNKKNGPKSGIVFRPVVLTDYDGSFDQVSDTNEESASQISQEEPKEDQFGDDSKDSSENLRNFSNYESTYNPPPNKKQKTNEFTKDTDESTHAATPQENSRNTIKDDCSIFAEYIAREMRKIKDDTILAMAKHQISNIIFESQMKYYQCTKNKGYSENSSPSCSNNYSSERDIRTSIELVPVKIEVD